MKLFNFYRKAAIYPSIFILFYCLVCLLINIMKREGLDIVPIVTTVLFSLVMSLLSLPIFLNKWLKRNLLWNTITWFLLPLGYITLYLVFDIRKRIGYDFGFGTGFIHLLIMTIPFVIGLSGTFVKYRRTVSATIHQQNV